MKSKDYIPRFLETYAFDENLTGRHMIFLAGPRQVGKTMLARNWLEEKGCSSLYFNWDDFQTRNAYLANSRFFESPARSLGIQVVDKREVLEKHPNHTWLVSIERLLSLLV